MYSFVRFVNRTERSIDVVWLNYEGIGVHYCTLKPGHCIDVNTFVGHPWIFRDSQTGDKLMVNSKEVYEPVGWGPQDGWPPKRKLVSIMLPSKLEFVVEGCNENNGYTLSLNILISKKITFGPFLHIIFF